MKIKAWYSKTTSKLTEQPEGENRSLYLQMRNNKIDSIEILESERQWNDTFKALKEKLLPA